MDTKKIIIIGGIVAVIGGIGLYMWSKNKKSAESGAETPADSTKSAEETKNAEAPADAPASPQAKTPLTKRKDKRKACGRKPLNKSKKAEWQKCVDAGGVASFEGSDFDQWENDYMDFSGLDLDL